MKKWMIYGANGYSGKLIANYAKEKGFTPIVAGRNKSQILDIANELALESRVFDLESHDNVVANIGCR